MNKISLVLKMTGEIIIRAIIFLSLIFLAGLLFWEGFDPFLSGLNIDIPFGELFKKFFFMSLINTIGAIFCVCYAFMAIFPYSFLEKK